MNDERGGFSCGQLSGLESANCGSGLGGWYISSQKCGFWGLENGWLFLWTADLENLETIRGSLYSTVPFLSLCVGVPLQTVCAYVQCPTHTHKHTTLYKDTCIEVCRTYLRIPSTPASNWHILLASAHRIVYIPSVLFQRNTGGGRTYHSRVSRLGNPGMLYGPLQF